MIINGFPVFIVALLIADGCLQGRYLLVDIQDNGTDDEYIEQGIDQGISNRDADWDFNHF